MNGWPAGPAGSLPAADAGPAGQPFIVLIVPGRGTAQVRNVFTFKTVATVQPPEGQHLAGVAAAGDDRTFVVEAQVGGQEAAGKFKPSYAAFDELRLSADGQPESLRLLFTIAAKPGLPGFTISQDASMLAYSTNNNGFETVSLATGTGRSWPAVDGGDGVAMSWAGDRALAFEWTNTTLATGPPGGTTHPPGVGLRVLDVTAPGTLVQASRLVVSYGRYCAASGACQGGQLMTPDGTKVLITKVVTRGQGYTDNVLEYSARTGQALASVVPVVNTPYAGPPCVPLWTDPSGEQVVSFCGGHGEQFDQGHVSRVTLHLPMYGLNFGASFAW
jgi:hypothetical protein